jgi:hypothetical protein
MSTDSVALRYPLAYINRICIAIIHPRCILPSLDVHLASASKLASVSGNVSSQALSAISLVEDVSVSLATYVTTSSVSG